MGMGKEGKEAADMISSPFPDAGYCEPGREQRPLSQLKSAEGALHRGHISSPVVLW